MGTAKKELGQFFTVTNPFKLKAFVDWINLIPEEKKKTIIEPFAGANNIVHMIKTLGYTNDWKCFDIEPNENNITPEYTIEKRDTLNNFPKDYYVAITNPPYLAKNSATKSKIYFPENKFDDLYKVSLDVMLNNLEYIAAIIPESFINSELFHNRLYGVISLTCKMFNDTDCPVCLALFIPPEVKKDLKMNEMDFILYRQNEKLGKYEDIKKEKPNPSINNKWVFNNPTGNIGIKCVDNLSTNSIKFIEGQTIDSSKIKISSRTETRISGLPTDIELTEFLTKCNQILDTYRNKTSDIFLTSFKGLRKDGKYRRRLDFYNAKLIMNKAIEEIRKEKDKTT